MKNKAKTFDEFVNENLNESKSEFITDDMLGRMSGYKEHGEKYVGAFNPKTAQRSHDYILLELSDFDRDLVKHVKMKPSEYIFRYETDTSKIGGMKPFVKVNIDSGRVYFLTDEGREKDIVEFEGRGIMTTYLKVRPEKLK